MTLAPPDSVKVALPDAPQDDIEAHTYAWYDPDAAAFDPLADTDDTDEDLVDLDWG
jgi:hypothetical protein